MILQTFSLEHTPHLSRQNSSQASTYEALFCLLWLLGEWSCRQVLSRVK